MVSRRFGERGFSLAEVIVAAVLLSGALIFASAAAGGTAAALRRAELDEGAIDAVERFCDSLLAVPAPFAGEGTRSEPPYRIDWRLGGAGSGVDVAYDTSRGERRMHFELRLAPPLPLVRP